MFRRRRDPDDVDREIRAHLEIAEAELRDAGLSDREARRQARLDFGRSPARATGPSTTLGAP
jgi:hypothetical protein